MNKPSQRTGAALVIFLLLILLPVAAQDPADPVIALSLTPASSADQDRMAKALNRFMKEDPTFRVSSDSETGQTIIAGMGELHLDVYVERME